MDELLSDRENIGAEILEELKKRTEGMYVEILSAGIKAVKHYLLYIMYMFYMYIIYDMHIFVKRFFENIFKTLPLFPYTPYGKQYPHQYTAPQCSLTL